MNVRILLISLPFIFLGAAPGKTAEIEHSLVGNWYLGAYTDDTTGVFSHCAIVGTYKSGIFMAFSVGSDFSWSLGFSDPQWTLTPGSTYNLTLSLDQGAPEAVTGTAINATGIEIPLKPTQSLFDHFRRSRLLTANAAAQTFYFNLDGTSSALDSMLACTQRHVLEAKQGPSSNPFVAQNSESATAASSSHKAEATAFMANLLSKSGVQGFYIVPPNDVPKDFSKNDVVWVAPGVVGTLNVFDVQQPVPPEQISSAIFARDAQSCKGKFASAVVPDKVDSKIVVDHIITACDSPDGTWSAYYAALSRADGGYYLLMTVGTGSDPSGAKNDDAGIVGAVYRSSPSQ